MSGTPTLLKALLIKRHLQGHGTFCREYDRTAAKVDPAMRGRAPAKAQFYRWLNGGLTSLPYADHCRILEAMFPGYTAQQLFEPYDGDPNDVPMRPTESAESRTAPAAQTAVAGMATADVVAVFPTRSQFVAEMPPGELFDGAQRIQMVGLSLNLLCQQYPDKALIEMLESGGIVECLFLAPDGRHIAAREQEEGLAVGTLSTLTRINIDTMRRVAGKLSDETRGNLRIKTYDETVRFNISLIDNAKCVVQPYLPDARGVESPTLVLQRKLDTPGLFDTFAQVFISMWERADEVTA